MGLNLFIREQIDEKKRAALSETHQGLSYHRLTDPVSTLTSVRNLTTYAFASTREDEICIFGLPKANTPKEVRGIMGLLIDNNRMPITFELCPGSTMNLKTLQTTVARLIERYKLGKIVIVADQGRTARTILSFSCKKTTITSSPTP